MAWPKYLDQNVGTTWYLKWQSEAERNFNSRLPDQGTISFGWFLWFLIRTAIYVYTVYHVLHFMKRKLSGPLGYGPMRRDPNLQKLRRVVILFSFLFPLFIFKKEKRKTVFS